MYMTEYLVSKCLHCSLNIEQCGGVIEWDG